MIFHGNLFQRTSRITKWDKGNPDKGTMGAKPVGQAIWHINEGQGVPCAAGRLGVVGYEQVGTYQGEPCWSR